ncbi:MAG: AAA family ATPase [Saprospiraceae bacterium]|nr:AAA family ATPase [Saprospiraceae bacterium]
MISKINLTNYKAFDKAELKIKPITILLGANSVGKSSIIQFLLLLEQTVLAEQRNYKSALKLNGNYVNLGETTNLHRRHDTNIPLQFSFIVKPT